MATRLFATLSKEQQQMRGPSDQHHYRLLAYGAPGVNKKVAKAIQSGADVRLIRNVGDIVPKAGRRHPPGVVIENKLVLSMFIPANRLASHTATPFTDQQLGSSTLVTAEKLYLKGEGNLTLEYGRRFLGRALPKILQPK